MELTQYQQKINEDMVIDYEHKLGKGAFGDVYRGVWISRKKLVAIKKLRGKPDGAINYMDEVNVMGAMDHENILKIHDVIQHKKDIYLIIEYCEGGSLDKEIRGVAIPELNCYQYLKQIVSAMCVVNQKKHIHRDLKPENILFTQEKTLKICDFGLARKIIGDDPSKLQKFSAKGTPLYASPQVIRHQEYSAKCDVWSAGVILVEMLTKVNPFHQATNMATLINKQAQLTKGGGYRLQGQYNQWFKDMVKNTLVYQEAKRWTFEQLMAKILDDDDTLLQELGNFAASKTPDKPVVNTGKTTGLIKQKAGNIIVIKPQTNADRDDLDVPHPKNQGLKTVTNMLEVQESNKKKLNVFKVYVHFLYNRGKLFTDISTKYFNIKTNTQQNGYKFTVLFLAIGIFFKSIDKIASLFSTNGPISLPDGTTFKTSGFDQVTAGELLALKKDYTTQIKEEKEKFQPTIKQIAQKMKSEKYKIEYPQLLKKHKDIFDQLTLLSKGVEGESLDYFVERFRTFFKAECLIPTQSNIEESFARVYWGSLKLANINEIIPMKQFENNYIINKLIDDSTKLPIAQIKSESEQLRQKLEWSD